MHLTPECGVVRALCCLCSWSSSRWRRTVGWGWNEAGYKVGPVKTSGPAYFLLPNKQEALCLVFSGVLCVTKFLWWESLRLSCIFCTIQYMQDKCKYTFSFYGVSLWVIYFCFISSVLFVLLARSPWPDGNKYLVVVRPQSWGSAGLSLGAGTLSFLFCVCCALVSLRLGCNTLSLIFNLNMLPFGTIFQAIVLMQMINGCTYHFPLILPLFTN